MKKKTIIAYITYLSIGLCSCVKTNVSPGTASLTVINTVVGVNGLLPNFSGTAPLIYYSFVRQISYGSYSTSCQFGINSGIQPLGLYNYPDTLSGSKPIFNLTLNLPVSSVHTLFCTGTPAAPDTVFTTDKVPYHAASDSTMSIRFINLSPGSSPVSVDLKGMGNGSEVVSMAYKGYTVFKNYTVNHTISSYTFEFRDAVSGTVLGTYSFSGLNNGSGTNTSQNNYRYRSFTIALYGLPGGIGTNAQKTLLINNY